MKSTALFLATILTVSLPNAGATELLAADEVAAPTVVVDEIMYHPLQELYDFPPAEVQDASFEYFELVNLTDQPINVAGWHFKDSLPQHDYVFPAGTTIAPFGYLVVCHHLEVMRDPRAYGNVLFATNSVGSFPFNLANDGDVVEVRDNFGYQIDYVQYSDGDPSGTPFRRRWPHPPDGSGPSLILVDLLSDNTIPENWSYSGLRGNPGTGLLVPPTATPTGTPTATGTPTPTSTATPSPTPWVDFNFDQRVDADDLLRLLDAYSAGSATPEVNGDGRLDRRDLLIFSLYWQRQP